jgi:hypothetical protein
MPKAGWTEAAGRTLRSGYTDQLMLRYFKGRYGDPLTAWGGYRIGSDARVASACDED